MSNQVKAYQKHHFIAPPVTKPHMRWDDLFFQILMVFHHPAQWSPVLVVLKLGFWTALVFGLWLLAAPSSALMVSLALLAFA